MKAGTDAREVLFLFLFYNSILLLLLASHHALTPLAPPSTHQLTHSPRDGLAFPIVHQRNSSGR